MNDAEGERSFPNTGRRARGPGQLPLPGSETGARAQGLLRNLGDLVASGSAGTAKRSEKQSVFGERGVGVPQYER